MNCFRTLFHYRRLIVDLTVLDLKIKYAGSFVGLIWMPIAPLLILGAYLILFGNILHVQSNYGVTDMEYGLLVAAGFLPWIGFSESVTRGTGSVLAQRSLLKSQLFPMELVPVTAVCAGLAGQLCGMLVLLVVVAFHGMIGTSLVFLPLLLILQTMFTVGLVWFLSCINILYRDTSQLVALLLLVLMLLSPIAYTRQMVPFWLGPLLQFNPLTYLIEGYRDAIVFGHAPNLFGMALFAMVAAVSLMAGFYYFMRLRRVLPDYV